jgi:hypothetical protein
MLRILDKTARMLRECELPQAGGNGSHVSGPAIKQRPREDQQLPGPLQTQLTSPAKLDFGLPRRGADLPARSKLIQPVDGLPVYSWAGGWSRRDG